MILRRIMVFILLGFTLIFGQNQQIQALFQQGNQLYQKGSYREAAEKYQKILEQGYESGALYFNLGNVYYKLKQPGLSRLYYERARKFLKNDEALKTNMQLLRMRLVDKIASPPEFILSVWWKDVLNLFNFSILTWLVAVLLAVVLLIAAFYLYHIRRARGGRLKGILIFSIVIWFLFLFILGEKIYNDATEKFAVVMKPTVTLYAEPSTSGTEVFVLHEGTKVQVRRKNNDWMEIRLEDGKTGWLEMKNVQVI